MAALKALPPAVRAVIRNPILVVLVGLFGLVQLPQLALQPTQPILAAMVSLAMTGLVILVMPFVQGGLLGMADEALAGTTTLGTLVSVGKANYVTLFLAYLALFAVNVVLGFVAMFGVLVGGLGLFAGDGQPGFAALAIVAVFGVVFALAYLVVAFFVQFYAHAIVLSDSGLVAGFTRSMGLVRSHLLSALGYSIIVLTGSLVFGGIAGIGSTLLSPQATGLPVPQLSTTVFLGAAIGYVVAIAIFGAFYATYSVAFYRAIETPEK